MKIEKYLPFGSMINYILQSNGSKGRSIFEPVFHLLYAIIPLTSKELERAVQSYR